MSSPHFPINIALNGQLALIVGGGEVATRKAESVLAVGARVNVIAPVVSDLLTTMAAENRIQLINRPYQDASDLQGALLVFAATNDGEVNSRVCRDARQLGILSCSATTPEAGTFITPAVIRRGDLVIAISTGGKSPALAAAIRKRLEREFGQEYAQAVELLGNARQKLLTGREDRAYNRKLLKMLAEDRFATLLEHSPEEVDLLLSEFLAEAEDKDAQ